MTDQNAKVNAMLIPVGDFPSELIAISLRGLRAKLR